MAIVTQSQLNPRRVRRIDYPTGDGKPMAETEKHRDLMIYCITALTNYYADRQDVQVSGNNFIYYQEGNPKARVSPDCYVVFGVPRRVRDSYMTWLEGGALPAVVFEFTSRSTQKEDRDTKRPLYERTLLIPEYFQFDPTGDYLEPRLQGFRLVEGRYQVIPMVEDRLYSAQLGLELVQNGEQLRLFDPTQRQWLPNAAELAQQMEMERARAEAEHVRAEAEYVRAEAEARGR